MNSAEPLLSASFSAAYGGKQVLRDFAFELNEGEILGLVGSSGSGKSTLALALLGLLRFRGGKATGHIHLRGRDVLACSEREWRSIRGKEIALVLQNAASSLNPVLTLEKQFKEAWRAHSAIKWEDARDWAGALLRGVDLPADDTFLRRLPNQISVGQAQRVLIALALLHKPSVLIADEPTSALDIITQKEVLGLLERLNRETGIAILCISHDLLSVASFCQRVAILHEGQIVDSGSTDQVFSRPTHPYTQKLMAALPRLARQEEHQRR